LDTPEVGQLCDNTWLQAVGEPVAGLLAQATSAAPSRRFVHLCNPYGKARTKTEILTQEVTYAAMHRAREFGPNDKSTVEFLGAVFPGDEDYALEHFDRTFQLQRSAKDVKAFGTERPLPLLFDILRGAEGSVADFVVFTNVDICPVPHFYRSIEALLNHGFDALVINRRTITGWPVDPGLIDLMAMDPGCPHKGYDCFVFPREALARFVTGNAVVGAGGVMQSLIYNLVALSQRLLFLSDVHLTYHLGNDKVWTAPHLRDYVEHNWTEAMRVLHQLATARPARFRDFCRTFRDSRTEVTVGTDGSVTLVRRPDCRGYLPDLEAIKRLHDG
jgi:hypothetical protein